MGTRRIQQLRSSRTRRATKQQRHLLRPVTITVGSRAVEATVLEDLMLMMMRGPIESLSQMSLQLRTNMKTRHGRQANTLRIRQHLRPNYRHKHLHRVGCH